MLQSLGRYRPPPGRLVLPDVSPKLFARIVRFRRAVFAARLGAPLAVAAAENAYADQSHFTKEAHALTNRSTLRKTLTICASLTAFGLGRRSASPLSAPALREQLAFRPLAHLYTRVS